MDMANTICDHYELKITAKYFQMVKSILRIYQVSCLIGVRRFFDRKLYRNFDAVHYTWAETNNAGRLMVIMVMMMNKTGNMMILLTLAMVYFVHAGALSSIENQHFLKI